MCYSSACQSFAAACERRTSALAQRYRSLAFLPRFPPRESSVALGQTSFAAVLRRSSHHKDRRNDLVDSPHTLELQGQDSAWRNSCAARPG